MITASWYFYAYWDYRLLPLLVCSILVNWMLAVAYQWDRRYLPALGVVLNLLLLGVFIAGPVVAQESSADTLRSYTLGEVVVQNAARTAPLIEGVRAQPSLAPHPHHVQMGAQGYS